jgi:hypothetical protein
MSTLFRVLMKLGGEPLQWGVPPGGLFAFLERNGYSLERSPTPDELSSRYLEPAGAGDEPVGKIERLAVARLSP